MRYILAVDVGTTALKAAVYGTDGRLTAAAAREYSFVSPSPERAEMAAEVYTGAFTEIVQTVLEAGKLRPEEIGAIGFSTQGETMLLLDEEERPLGRAILWCDTRAAAEASEIVRQIGREEIRTHTGQVGEDAIWPGAKILWLRRHKPEILERTRRIVQLEGWFSLLLTGEAYGEDSILGSSIYFDIRERRYWPRMLDFLGLEEEQLPRIAQPGSIIGTVTEEAAVRFGLAAGTPVSIGGIDLACGAVGVGNIHPGSFSDVTGSSLCTMAMTGEILTDPAGQMPCYCSAVPGLYMIHAYASGGIGLRWLREIFYENHPSGEVNLYDQMDMLAADCPAGADGLIALPHLLGAGPPDLCPEMKGVFLGLTPAHGRGQIVRAMMEGVAMILCRILEVTDRLGLRSDRIVCLGGGAKSGIWCQIKADATGREVVTTKDCENAGCTGAAMLAGTAVGMLPDLDSAVKLFVREDRHYLPDPENRQVYDHLRHMYAAAMKALRALCGENRP